MSRTKTVLAAMAALSLSPAAFAAGWSPIGTADPATPNMVFSAPEDGAAVLLACGNNGRMSAVVSASGMDFERRMGLNAPYTRKVDVSLNIGDEVSEDGNWQIIPAIDAVKTRDHTMAAKLFNATVRGDKPLIRMQDSEFTLDLPGIDDTFTAFAKTCTAKPE